MRSRPLAVALLIGADKFCIGEDMAFHRKFNFGFGRLSSSYPARGACENSGAGQSAGMVHHSWSF
jgi:hypothetical protein